MKFFLLTLLLIALNTTNCVCQILSPIKWRYSTLKVSNNTYKISFKATIQSGWHIYSQVQPKKAIVQPLQFAFSKNSQLLFEGKPKEIGKIIKGIDKSINTEDYHYVKNLEVIQIVKVNYNNPTILKGTISYQTCNNEMCLPPEDFEFSIPLK